MPILLQRARLLGMFGLGALAVLGCESKQRVAPGAGSATTATPRPSAEGKLRFPPEARRDSPPKGIAESALAVGKPAPALEGLASTSGSWSRASKVTALVFYRGHW
ncbi:MAG: hypothetical protein IPI67_36195 [Myxococcales bacterium]|nr:hypothetical protein [Myxococcales bacterium]